MIAEVVLYPSPTAQPLTIVERYVVRCHKCGGRHDVSRLDEPTEGFTHRFVCGGVATDLKFDEPRLELTT